MNTTSVFEWIARLPLCGEPELAELLDAHELDVRRLTHALVREGWVESLEPASPELEQRRRYLVRPGAATALARAMQCPKIGRHLPVRRQDILRRVARFEVSCGVNRLVAELASDVREGGPAVLADARSVPLALPTRERWWLPATEGYGCLQAGRLWAPFLVAWDRAAAPDAYRRHRLASWTRARTRVARCWGADGLPPVLVVCPSEQALAVWERGWLEIAAREGPPPPAVLLATRSDLDTCGPGGVVWRGPGSTDRAPLVERAGWGAAPACSAPPVPEDGLGAIAPAGGTGNSLRRWAVSRAVDGTPHPAWDDAAALAIVTGTREQVLVQWVARHPLLSASELAVLTHEPRALVERRMEWLARCQVISAAPKGVM